MFDPLPSLRHIHEAFRLELLSLEERCNLVETDEHAVELLGRVRFFESMLDAHTLSEERELFSEVEERSPNSVATYSVDHAEDKRYFRRVRGILSQIQGAQADARGMLLRRLCREVNGLSRHLSLHILKEEQVLTPLVETLFTDEEQLALERRMLETMDPEVLARFIPWVTQRLEPARRLEWLASLRALTTGSAFRELGRLLQEGLSHDDWEHVRQQVPGLL